MLFDRGVKIPSRALGSVINKLKICKDLGYGPFSQLYAACVKLRCNAVENCAIRCFLGVHKFVPVLAALVDMGWVPESI